MGKIYEGDEEKKMRTLYFPQLKLKECKPDYINLGWEAKLKDVEKKSIELLENIKQEGLKDPLLGCITDYRRSKEYFWQVTAGERRWLCLRTLGVETAPYILKFQDWHSDWEMSKHILSEYEYTEMTLEESLALFGTPGDKVPTKIVLKRWERERK